MTAHDGIGNEASDVFQKLCLGETVSFTRYLMVAPNCLRNKVIEKIDQQIRLAKAGQEAYVGVKINSLTDKTIIDKLQEASCAGVKIELIVRGSCCLISQIPGMTENITVRSIVGRYLEHSRSYIFGKDDIYIASADFMTRNTTRRVEVAAPIFDEDIKKQIVEMFRIMMQDNVKARVQLADGQYVKQDQGKHPLNSQKYFAHKEENLLKME